MRIATFSMPTTESSAPLTRTMMRSPGVSMVPEAITAFWLASVAATRSGSMPNPAICRSEKSMLMTSSCTPMRSTLPTLLTRSSSARMYSAWSRSSRYVKPSLVSA